MRTRDRAASIPTSSFIADKGGTSFVIGAYIKVSCMAARCIGATPAGRTASTGTGLRLQQVEVESGDRLGLVFADRVTQHLDGLEAMPLGELPHIALRVRIALVRGELEHLLVARL